MFTLQSLLMIETLRRIRFQVLFHSSEKMDVKMAVGTVRIEPIQRNRRKLSYCVVIFFPFPLQLRNERDYETDLKTDIIPVAPSFICVVCLCNSYWNARPTALIEKHQCLTQNILKNAAHKDSLRKLSQRCYSRN
uniref:Secreted protein n=1 Tax=Heterorhabditis bacteriophora TaxID=37862 RepID=A0A1I7WAA6_HETBA